jgi:methylase of polypeptide subunit release factors
LKFANKINKNMWKQKTQLHEELVEIISATLEGTLQDSYSITKSIEDKLKLYPVADPFEVILDERINEKFFDINQNEDFNKWVEKIRDPRTEISVRTSILYVLWDRFASTLSDNLRNALALGAIPKDSYVLVFVAGLSKCIVIHYKFTGLIPKLEAKVVIDSPKSVFDIWNAIDFADQSSKNYLKRTLTSGHKLISHRGVLVHVDRRNESQVFGPSIDTLIMAEELSRVLYEKFSIEENQFANEPHHALEIGVGSGFLATSVMKNLPSLQTLTCIDIEAAAINCTKKNIEVAKLTPGVNKPQIDYLISNFDVSQFREKNIDLIICNPPYIPHPPNGKDSLSGHYLPAVGGLELIEYIIRELPNVLSRKGKLLLMVSSLALDETLELIPKSYFVQRPFGNSGYKVLFDVEAVLEDQKWLHFLENKDKLKLHKDRDNYFHILHPLWISLSEQ